MADNQSQSVTSTPLRSVKMLFRALFDENSFILIARPLYDGLVEPDRRNSFDAMGVSR